MAILDEMGDNVLVRFPLPIMKIIRTILMPQSETEYEHYIKNHAAEIAVLHDFRLLEHKGFIYVIFHDGIINMAYDVVKRMPIEQFRAKVERSTLLSSKPVDEIQKEWEQLWWVQEV